MMHLPRYVKEYYSHQKVNVASHREQLASTFGEIMGNRSYKSKTKRIIFSFWRKNFQRIEKSRTSQQKNITVPKDLMLEIWSDLGLRDIYIMTYVRKEFSIYSNIMTDTYEETHALVLRPIRAKEVQIRNQTGMMDIAVKGQSLLKVNNIDKSWPLSMFSTTLYDFVQWKANLVKRTKKKLYHEHAPPFVL